MPSGSSQRGAASSEGCCWPARPSRFPMSWPIRNTHIPICRRLPAIGQFSAFPFCGEKSRSAFCFCAARRSNPSRRNRSSWFPSSPTDVGPVLEAIVKSACELCEAYDATVLLRDGDDLRISEHHGPIPIGLEKWPINRYWIAGRAFLDQKPVHVRDVLSEEGADFPDGQEMSRRMGHRSILSVPLLREGESIGAIVLRRTEVQPFSDKQIALLQ